MSIRIAHDNADYLVRFLAVLDLQENGLVCVRHIKDCQADALPFLMFFREAG
jgi:hypothetical protein